MHGVREAHVREHWSLAAAELPAHDDDPAFWIFSINLPERTGEVHEPLIEYDSGRKLPGQNVALSSRLWLGQT